MACPSLTKKLITITLVLALPFSSLHSMVPAQSAPHEEAISAEDAERLMSDPQVVKQLQGYVLQYQLPAIFSKIESLRLIISNNTLKLTDAEKAQLLENLASARKSLEENINLLIGNEQQPVSDKDSIITGLLFGKQLMSYLTNAIKSDFKKMKPFSFVSEQTQELTAQQIVELFKEVIRLFEQLELSFNDIGATKQAKLAKRMSAFLDKYGIVAKAKLSSIVIFGILLARYYTKESSYKTNSLDLPATPKELPTDSQKNPSDLDFNAFDVSKSSVENPTQEPPLQNTSPSAREKIKATLLKPLFWIDENIVGVPPKEEYDFVSREIHLKPGTGTGLFGKVHDLIKPFIAFLGFAEALSKMVNTTANGINSWKSLNRNTSAFFKIDELFKNKQQKISAIDEFFLSSAIEHTTPRLTFDDIAGLEEQKKELEPVINYLLNPELFEKTGTSIEKGYLFYGPTRTGKTHLAEALAGELVIKHKKKLAFIKIRGSELRLIGIKKVLDMVDKHAPCIVFVDEIDLLNLQRDHNTTLLDEFLTYMKHDTGNHQVIFLAATNRIDHLDHALLQPGRFGKIIPFENPSRKDRKAFFEKHLASKNMYDPELLDIERLVQETEGCSFGELASVTNNALTLATQKREMLAYRHFDISIDTFKHKIADASINLPQEERSIIAAHLAGHALAHQLLATGQELHKVTMLPVQKKIAEENIWMSKHAHENKVTHYGEVLTLHRADTGGLDTFEQKSNCIKALLAGHAAEKILLGSCGYGYHGEDLEEAHKIAESLVFQGLKKEYFSRDAADKKLDEVMNILASCETEVTALLQENKGKLEKLAQELNKHVTLTAHDITVLTQFE